MIFGDDLGAARQPVSGKFRAEVGLHADRRGVVIVYGVVSGTIEVGVAPVVAVGFPLLGETHEPIMLDTVRGSADMQALSANRSNKFTCYVAMRAHLGGGPVG